MATFCNYMKLLPRFITIICYVLFVKDQCCCFLCVFVGVQFVISASKFSRSPYLDNHLPENTHTWTIGTLSGWLSFHDIGPQGWG